MKKIYLLTGPKNSGKSTRLLQWVEKQKSIIGIICPRENGKRELFSIYSNTFKEYEVDDEKRPVFKIGKYKFLKDSFDWAENELLKAWESKPQWLVIDEIGPLELQGDGFDKIVKQLLFDSNLPQSNLLIVVREDMIREVISNYNLDKWQTEIADFI
jgi:nucleoside-triphosphatase THEP1